MVENTMTYSVPLYMIWIGYKFNARPTVPKAIPGFCGILIGEVEGCQIVVYLKCYIIF